MLKYHQKVTLDLKEVKNNLARQTARLLNPPDLCRISIW